MVPTPLLLMRMCYNAFNEWKEKTEGKERKESKKRTVKNETIVHS